MVIKGVLAAAIGWVFAGYSLTFTPPGEYALQKKAEEVAVHELEEVQDLIEEMFSIAKGERNETGKGRIMVGLAAPQVGCLKRIILVDVGFDSETRKPGTLKAYINPQIIWRSQEMVEGKEGCYSVDRHVVGIVSRSERIQVSALERDGTPITEEFSGFTARVFQHEVDHLEGIRFPDRVGAEGILHWVEEDEVEQYREQWQQWPHRCPWELWIAMKQGLQRDSSLCQGSQGTESLDEVKAPPRHPEKAPPATEK